MISLDYTLRDDIDEYNSNIVLNDLIKPLLENPNQELINHSMTFDGNGSGIIKIPSIQTNMCDVRHELDWYYSLQTRTTVQSRRMKLWNRDVGLSNSNYGYIVFSAQNGLQFENVVNELKRDNNSRRAVINYTNPFIQYVGQYDYICTQYVSYFIRDNLLSGLVSMRSNDAINGLIYCDLYWQLHILNKLASTLNIGVDKLYWHSTNIHIYDYDKINIGIDNEIVTNTRP